MDFDFPIVLVHKRNKMPLMHSNGTIEINSDFQDIEKKYYISENLTNPSSFEMITHFSLNGIACNEKEDKSIYIIAPLKGNIHNKNLLLNIKESDTFFLTSQSYRTTLRNAHILKEANEEQISILGLSRKTPIFFNYLKRINYFYPGEIQSALKNILENYYDTRYFNLTTEGWIDPITQTPVFLDKDFLEEEYNLNFKKIDTRHPMYHICYKLSQRLIYCMQKTSNEKMMLSYLFNNNQAVSIVQKHGLSVVQQKTGFSNLYKELESIKQDLDLSFSIDRMPQELKELFNYTIYNIEKRLNGFACNKEIYYQMFIDQDQELVALQKIGKGKNIDIDTIKKDLGTEKASQLLKSYFISNKEEILDKQHIHICQKEITKLTQIITQNPENNINYYDNHYIAYNDTKYGPYTQHGFTEYLNHHPELKDSDEVLYWNSSMTAWEPFSECDLIQIAYLKNRSSLSESNINEMNYNQKDLNSIKHFIDKLVPEFDINQNMFDKYIV